MQKKGTVWKVCAGIPKRLRKTKETLNATVANEESSSGFFQSAKTFLFGKKGVRAIKI
jgi:hypothetical protein